MTANIKVQTKTSKNTKRVRQSYYKKTPAPAPVQAESVLDGYVVPYVVFLKVLKMKWDYNATGHGSRIALIERCESDRASGWTQELITSYLMQKWRRKNEVPLTVYNYLNAIRRLAPRNLASLPFESRRVIGERTVALLTALPPYSVTA